MHNFINPEYLDLVREFIELDYNKISVLDSNKKKTFKVFSENIISIIPEKTINQFTEKGTVSNEKYLFFLQMNEYLK